VQPIGDGSEKIIGYKHVSKQHIKHGAWVSDLVSPKAMRNVQVQGREVLIECGTAWETLDRDCCLLLENLFFARGQGIAFDKEAMGLLRRAQPGKTGIDAYAVFGRTAGGQVNGLRGTFLPIPGDLADSFMAWLKDRSRTVQGCQRNDGDVSGPRCILTPTDHRC
jgi:hypothetical protein